MIRSLSRLGSKPVDYFLTFSCIVKKNSNYYVMLHENEYGYITMPSTVLPAVPMYNLNIAARKTIPTLFKNNIHDGLSIPSLDYQPLDIPKVKLIIDRGIECCYGGYFDLDYKIDDNMIADPRIEYSCAGQYDQRNKLCYEIVNDAHYYNHENNGRSSRNTLKIKNAFKKFENLLNKTISVDGEYRMLSNHTSYGKTYLELIMGNHIPKDKHTYKWVKTIYFLKLFSDIDKNNDSKYVDLNKLEFVISYKDSTWDFPESDEFMNFLNANLQLAYQHLSRITTRPFIVESIKS